jgi:hypothetical protein
MKTIKKISLVLLVAIATTLSTSCSSDDGGSGGNAAAGTVQAKIDGASFTSATLLTTGVSITAGANTTLFIQGTDIQGKGFNFNINNFTGVGTYDIGGSSSVFVVANYVEGNATKPLDTQAWTAPYDDDSKRGEISVSSITADKVIGTFSFTSKNPNGGTVKTITEGSFNVEL